MSTHQTPRFHRAAFNLVEVVLALLVVAVGMMAIVGLVPIGSAANRDAIANNYSADAADHYLNWFGAYLQDNWGTPLPSDFIPDTPTDISSVTVTDFDPTALDGANFYKHTNLTANKGVYRILHGPTIDGEIVPDFDAVARVWISPTVAWEYNGTNYLEVSDDTFAARAQVNLELSWPTSIPYAGRHKAYYTMEVFKR